MEKPPQPASSDRPEPDSSAVNPAGADAAQPGPLVEGTDFYYEGPYMVFTAEFLRRRGTCCRSGCRHCPYGFTKAEQEAE